MTSTSSNRQQPHHRPHRVRLTVTATVVACLATVLVSAPVAVAAPTFSDVPTSHPFYDEIEWMVAEGVTTGYPDGTFRPSASITRQAMAAFFYRYSGSPAFTPPTTPSFTDVPKTHPFYKEIQWMVAEDLAGGYPDGTFRPGGNITRQAQAAFFYRFAGEPTFTPPTTPSFSDVAKTHPFFTEIEWLADSGITGGYPDGTFRPGGNVTRQASAAFFFRYDELFGASVPGAPTGVTGAPGDSQATVSWTAPANDGGSPVTGYRVTASPGGAIKTVAAPATMATVTGLTNGQAYTFTVAAENAIGYGPESAPSSAVIPQAPGFVPPPLDPTVAPSLYESTRFLYTGPDPVQRDIDPDLIDPDRVAVLRGVVLDTDGQPVSGVRVELPDRPEFGWTTTRSQGEFDLVVNAGGSLLVDAHKDGTLPVQRWVTPAAQAWAQVDDVVLTPLDTEVTTVDADATVDQVVQSSTESDADGVRQATLVVPAGTSAEMVMDDGSTEPLPTLDIRATEYTVGDEGPEAMPGELPPASGYTYAVEFSADEALDADATSVEFDQPLISYTENFIGFPVGTPVPAGWYDKDAGEWVPSADGLVIGIVSEASGRANVDIDGDGTANTATELATVGIDLAEREHLADLYGPGDELWRVEITHFTPWDYNWPYGCSTACVGPNGEPPRPPDGGDDQGDCQSGGSIITCQEQTLGENVDLVGVPFDLVYQSDRVPGRADSRTIDIPLVGDTVPDGVLSVEVTVDIAGQHHAFTYAPAPGATAQFTWDGRDAYGRPTGAPATATVKVTYVYQAVYKDPAGFSSSFGAPGRERLAAGGGVPDTRADITADRAAGLIRSTTTSEVLVQGLDASGLGFGGWTLSVHHRLDRATRLLHLGSGGTRGLPDRILGSLVSRFAGTGVACASGPCGDGGDAVAASLRTDQLAAAPDGSLYLHDDATHRIRRIAPDGTITTVAGNGNVCAADPTTGCGTGGPATSAPLAGLVVDLAVAPNGTLYLLEDGGNVVRSVRADGVIRHVAGTGSDCLPSAPDYPQCGSGGPATAAPIEAVSLSFAGNQLLLAETLTSRDPVIRTVTSAGTMLPLYGCPDWGDSTCDGATDGATATNARLDPTIVAGAPDGSVFFLQGTTLRRIDPKGVLSTVAGGRDCTGSADCGDTGPAIDAGLHAVTALTVDTTGAVYLLDRYDTGHVVRRVTVGGRIERLAGGGEACSDYPTDPCGDGEPAILASIHRPTCCSPFTWSPLAVGADGRLLVTDSGLVRVLDRSSSLPDGSFGIASTDGNQVYVFDEQGRHLRTDDARSGLTDWTFGYDADGRVVTVTDRVGNVTTIERDGSGNATAIVSPFGLRTTLAVGADGWLASVKNPANETRSFTYHDGGLLATYAEPSGDTWTLTYDAAGRLLRDQNPLGGFTQLELTVLDDGQRVTSTTAEGRVTTYETLDGAAGATVHRTIDPAGAVTTTETATDGTTTVTYPDGRTLSITYQPDPRFAMDAPIARRMIETLPSGLTRVRDFGREVVLTDTADPLSLVSQTDWVTENGSITTEVTYDRPSRTQTNTSAEGRVTTTVYESRGLPLSYQAGIGVPLTYTYNARGLLTSTTMGDRSTSTGYDAAGRAVTQTDDAGKTTTVTYDAAGRQTSVKLPTGGTYTFAYDVDGNQTAVTTPGGGTYVTTYDAVNDPISSSAPGRPARTKVRDLDGRTIAETIPDGRTIGWDFAPDGRLTSIQNPQVTGSVSYFDTTDRPASVAQTPGGGVPGLPATTSVTWDANLRTSLTASAGSTATVDTGWDDLFRPTGTTTTVGVQTVDLAYGWDDDELMTQLGSFTVVRDPASGLPTSMSDGTATFTHGWSATYGDETSNAMTVGGSPKFSETLTRDGTGRITGTTTTTPSGTTSRTYAYDASGRLLTVKQGTTTLESYAWDQRGNLTTGPAGAATYAADDRPLTAGGQAITHDANGFRTGRAGDTYEWSASGDLLRAVVSGEEVTYSYDVTGLRVARTDSTGTTQYVYGDPAFTTRVTGTVAPDGTLTSLTYDEQGRLISFRRNGATFYVATDHLGTPRVVTDAAGAVLLEQRLDAFGNVVSSTGPGIDLPIGFAGGITDPATGFVRFGLRDYDPATGVWVKRDPAGFGGGLNHFAYVGGDPVGRTDPTGLFGLPFVDLDDIDFPDFNVCLGGSAYAGLGGGAEVCVGSGGVSVCGEVGVGIGGGFGPSVNTGGVGGNSVGAGASASAGCGPLSAEVGIETTVNSCGSSVTVSASAGKGPVSVGGSKTWNSDGTTEGGAGIGAGYGDAGSKDFLSGKCSAEAKLTANFCLGTG